MDKHDPFERWILEDEILNEDQEASLNLHMASCEQCRQVKQSWQMTHQLIKTSGMAAPAPGFSQRFQASLVERRARQQQTQVRRFFQYLIGINLLSFLGLAGTFILGTSPLDVFSGLLHGSVSAFLYARQAQSLILTLFHSVPLFVPVVGWILLSTGFCLAALVWGASIWRYLIKGVGAK